MAGLTREERSKREVEQKAKLRKEIEEQVRSEIIHSNDNVLEKENQELKSQIEEMMNMIKDLQKGNETLKSKTIDTDFDSVKDVEMNARILVTSMTTGGVNMKTANDGSARHFRLEKLGQTIPIIYEHLINCINTDRWLFEDGLVYINNADVVKEQYLEESYQKFLTPEKIEHIIDFGVDTIKEMVSSTTAAIQETIANVVARKINSGGSIDMNKVEVIGKSCTPQIDIRDLANKLR